jgi:serine/threonine protein kinase
MTTIPFRAPERFHNVNPNFASDMWSYMCLFTVLYLGFIPIHTVEAFALSATFLPEVLGQDWLYPLVQYQP